MEKYLYEVIGENTVLNHSEVDERTGERKQFELRAGDKVNLPYKVALELRGQLKPLTEAGAFPVAEQSVAPLTMATHEREDLLVVREKELRDQLDKVQAELETVRAQGKQEQEARAAKTRATAKVTSEGKEA